MKINNIRVLSAAMALVMVISLTMPALAAADPAHSGPPPAMEEVQSMASEPTPYADSNIVYVSASGSDGNPGSEDSPFRTLEAAFAAVPDGGTLQLIGELQLEANVTFD